jgi:hypothetical protein
LRADANIVACRRRARRGDDDRMVPPATFKDFARHMELLNAATESILMITRIDGGSALRPTSAR